MNASMLVWGFVRPRTPQRYFPTAFHRKTFVNNLLMRPASDRRVPLLVANVKCNHGPVNLTGGTQRGKGGQRQ